MNTNSNTKSISNPHTKRSITLVNPETRGLLTLGRQKGWDCAVLGRAPLPEAPVRLGDWLIVPAQQDSSEMPTRALDRVQAIFAAGLRPKGFVMVHEAPPLLSPPEVAKPDISEASPLPKPNIESFTGMLKGLATGLAVLSTLAVSALTFLGTAGIAVGTILIDPILIAVTEDETWIEIDRWWS